MSAAPAPIRLLAALAAAALAADAAGAEAAREVGQGRRGRRQDQVAIQILALNDFHGQLEPGRTVGGRPVGGAAVLAAWLEAARAGREDVTYLVHAGDLVGASPPASALLQDEPAVSFWNLFAGDRCGWGGDEGERREAGAHARCNVVGVLGNHELDDGREELMRLLGGGDHPRGPFLEAPWRGARYPTLAANVVDAATGRPILPPYVVRTLGGVKVGFIGLALQETPTIVTPSGVAGLRFLPEAETANRYVAELRRQGVRAVVVLVHQGGATVGGALRGDIVPLVAALDGEVDVVVSGHRHALTNALVPNAAGEPVLVTQAFSSGTAYADIDLVVDRRSGDVVRKRAWIQTAWADEGPGLAPDPRARALQDAAAARVAPLVARVVGAAGAAVTRAADAEGELPLGLVIADAQRAAVGADLAFMNPGGVRADLDAGPITWGELFAVQPFGNSVVAVRLTGAQVRALLAQQFAVARVLQPSGLRWTYRNASPGDPVATRVLADVFLEDGAPLDDAAVYTVAVNSFLAEGGDGFTALRAGTARAGGPVDLDALEAYVAPTRAGAALAPPPTDRVTRVP